MKITVLQAKLHRAVVTNSELTYEGSIFIDKNLLEEAGILAYQKVEIYNINNGERFSTYTIPVEEKGEVCINGAAARLVQKGDRIIVCAYCEIKREEAKNWQPKVLLIQEKNNNFIIK